MKKRKVAQKLSREKNDRFEIAPAGQLQKKYGLYAENAPELHLDAAKVPKNLRHLIPLAEKFGVSDDIMRLDLMKKTPKAELKELQKVVMQHEELLLEWLAGSAADQKTFSDEYIAFSAMLMAVDEC